MKRIFFTSIVLMFLLMTFSPIIYGNSINVTKEKLQKAIEDFNYSEVNDGYNYFTN